MGYGAVIYQDGKVLKEYSGFEGAAFGNTNNVAEYKAVLWLLEQEELNAPDVEITVYGDSRLVINQLGIKNWCIRKGSYVFFAEIAKQKISHKKNIKFVWIPREQNAYADYLSKRELINRNIEIRDGIND
jgi:ribonuclease HI